MPRGEEHLHDRWHGNASPSSPCPCIIVQVERMMEGMSDEQLAEMSKAMGGGTDLKVWDRA